MDTRDLHRVRVEPLTGRDAAPPARIAGAMNRGNLTCTGGGHVRSTQAASCQLSTMSAVKSATCEDK